MHESSRRPLWSMLISALAFAAMGAFTHALADRCDWLVIALVRAVFMFVMAVAMARLRGVRLAVFRPPTLWWRSLAGSFSLVCNFFALTRLPVADVLALTNTYPLWIVLLSALFLAMPPTRGELLGILCGVAGVIVLQQPHLGGSRVAIAVALAASVSTALAMLGLHRLKGVDARAIVAHFAGVASLVSGLGLLARGGGGTPTQWDATTVGLLLATAASATIGQFFLTRAYAEGLPNRLAPVGLCQVLFGLGFDVLWWGRRLGLESVVGFVLVLAPTGWLMVRSRGRIGGARPPVKPEQEVEETDVVV
jgi:drug/metabolite transporter (DMT)-like permease